MTKNLVAFAIILSTSVSNATAQNYDYKWTHYDNKSWLTILIKYSASEEYCITAQLNDQDGRITNPTKCDKDDKKSMKAITRRCLTESSTPLPDARYCGDTRCNTFIIPHHSDPQSAFKVRYRCSPNRLEYTTVQSDDTSCDTPDTRITQRITYLSSGDYTLTEKSLLEIHRHIADIKPKYIYVQSYADSTDTDEKNMLISWKRAAEIAKELANHSIPTSIMWYGENMIQERSSYITFTRIYNEGLRSFDRQWAQVCHAFQSCDYCYSSALSLSEKKRCIDDYYNRVSGETFLQAGNPNQ